MRRSLSVVSLVLSGISADASAQPVAPESPPPAPAPTPEPTPAPAPAPAQPPPQEGQIPPETPPPPLQSPYPYYYNYNTPPQQQPGPVAPTKPKVDEATCCRFAVRFNPFDLLLRRMTFETEVAIWGPFSLEVDPSWIWGSPTSQVDANGFAIKGVAGFYLTAKAPQGFFIKAIVEYERYTATVTNPQGKGLTQKGVVASPVLGALVGSSTVFGKRWGFNISGGIGVGIATAGAQTVVAPGNDTVMPYAVTFYGKGNFVQLIGSLAAGIGF